MPTKEIAGGIVHTSWLALIVWGQGPERNQDSLLDPGFERRTIGGRGVLGVGEVLGVRGVLGRSVRSGRNARNVRSGRGEKNARRVRAYPDSVDR